MLRRFPQVMLLLLALALTGCEGSLIIGVVNTPIPDDDDDDVGPPDIDLSDFEGTEYLNIRWDPEQADAGFVDCQEVYDVSGFLLDGHDGCADCDVVWAVELEADDEGLPCLNQGTDLDPGDEFERYVGMNFRGNDEFSLYRSTQDSGDGLIQVGEGAFDGLSFTWSGVGAWEYHFESAAFTLYFSGEGDF
jgi:hypothetical protein